MPLFHGRGYSNTSFTFPRTVLKAFRVETRDAAGVWATAYETTENHQRLVRGTIGKEITAMRLIPLSTYFSELKETVFDSAVAHIFAFEPV